MILDTVRHVLYSRLVGRQVRPYFSTATGGARTRNPARDVASKATAFTCFATVAPVQGGTAGPWIGWAFRRKRGGPPDLSSLPATGPNAGSSHLLPHTDSVPSSSDPAYVQCPDCGRWMSRQILPDVQRMFCRGSRP